MQATVTLERVRRNLRFQIQSARDRSDEIFTLVHPDALFERPIPERHRLIFYLGHLEAFEWNLICSDAFDMKSAEPQLDRLFAFGIDPTNGNLPQDALGDWPSESRIRGYNQRVRRAVDHCLEYSLERDSELHLFQMAVEHRLMHVETLSYLIHALPYALKQTRGSLPPETPPIRPEMVRITGGSVTLGQKKQAEVFGWDNEYNANEVQVPDFEMSVYKVTNGQFLDFVNAGGYQERSFWTESSWEWLQMGGIEHPKFWQRRNGMWYLRAMFDELPLQQSWPVYVSHAEAQAYCRWKGQVLPSEAQFHRAAYGTPHGEEQPYPWGSLPPRHQFGNFAFQRWDPAPVNAHPDGDSAFGVSGLVGNGWEWTSTPFEPFPGFAPDPAYRGYSSDFFDGGHYVLKGASPRTATPLLRRSFRNWFQPRYPHIYASFRGVQV